MSEVVLSVWEATADGWLTEVARRDMDSAGWAELARQTVAALVDAGHCRSGALLRVTATQLDLLMITVDKTAPDGSRGRLRWRGRDDAVREHERISRRSPAILLGALVEEAGALLTRIERTALTCPQAIRTAAGRSSMDVATLDHGKHAKGSLLFAPRVRGFADAECDGAVLVHGCVVSALTLATRGFALSVVEPHDGSRRLLQHNLPAEGVILRGDLADLPRTANNRHKLVACNAIGRPGSVPSLDALAEQVARGGSLVVAVEPCYRAPFAERAHALGLGIKLETLGPFVVLTATKP